MFLSGFAYDSVYVIANAIISTGSFNNGAIVPDLEATNYVGVMGKVLFTHTHDLLVAPGIFEFPLVQIQNSKYVTYYPASVADGTYSPPV